MPEGLGVNEEKQKPKRSLPLAGVHPAKPQGSYAHPWMQAEAEPLPEGYAARGGDGKRTDTDTQAEELNEQIVETLKTIYDPEIPVNLYELGLIYGIDVKAEGEVLIRMTLTAPACPVAGALVQEVADKVGELPAVANSHVQLVWDPPWTQDRMSEEAMLELGLL